MESHPHGTPPPFWASPIYRVSKALFAVRGGKPGRLNGLEKSKKIMIYLAVSVTNGCGYCITSHTAAARKAGMSEAMFGEVMAVVGMANEANRLANGYRVPIDPAFE